jgi:Tfp pilus assembly protein PilE
MCSKTIPVSRLGLTLVEVLGATAVLVTLATISVVSIRDSVQAGQKATLQRELQQLNTALEGYKSAGGVIPEDADVAKALQLLKDGVDLAGDGNPDYASLVTDPPLSMQVAGEPYELQFTPEDGFSYGSASGSVLVDSGREVQPIEPVITNESLPSVLNYMSTLDRNSPGYADTQSQLALAMASDLLTPENKQAIADAMLADGYVYNPETLSWEGVTGAQTGQVGATDPGPGPVPTNPVTNYKFDITDPALVQNAMDSLPSLRSWNDQDPNMDPRDYSQTIAALLAASQQGHENYTPEGVKTFVDGELAGMMSDIDEARRMGQSQQWASLMNSMVKVLEVDGYYNGQVADFIVGQRMGRMDHNGIPESFKVDSVDWMIQTPNQAPATLYQPTGANANITPVLGRVFKLEAGDTLSALFGTPESSGVVGGDTVHTAQRAVVMINGSASTYYWNNNLNRWTRVFAGSPDATDYVIPQGSLVYLRPAP